MCSAPGGEGEAAVCDKLHNHFDHVPLWQQTQKLAGEAEKLSSMS